MTIYFFEVQLISDDSFFNEYVYVIGANSLTSAQFGQCIKLIKVYELHIFLNHFI